MPFKLNVKKAYHARTIKYRMLSPKAASRSDGSGHMFIGKFFDMNPFRPLLMLLSFAVLVSSIVSFYIARLTNRPYTLNKCLAVSLQFSVRFENFIPFFVVLLSKAKVSDTRTRWEGLLCHRQTGVDTMIQCISPAELIYFAHNLVHSVLLSSSTTKVRHVLSAMDRQGIRNKNDYSST